ncbi:uncharacterized protein [Rutidosis leptorrhynchoides]|uniref:uncharacterized protein n=1 Tax=Rutidosis leptorrhynchoides TaxID=125765 RepID=UPI003A99F701
MNALLKEQQGGDETDIMEEVLCDRTGHQRGVGPKLPKSATNSASSSSTGRSRQPPMEPYYTASQIERIFAFNNLIVPPDVLPNFGYTTGNSTSNTPRPSRNNDEDLYDDGFCDFSYGEKWTEDPKTVKEAVTEHFKEIFRSRSLDRPELVQWARAVGADLSSITGTEACELEAAFTESELWNAVNECGSSKAPGPDGFNFGFYKKFWYVIKDDLMEAIHSFWETREISKGCNASFITLIPKKVDPLWLNDFRPISLIGSYYKIVAKLLANRLKKWRNWIHVCLKSASISILVNGSPTNEFMLERGVRQGDPLSPFLFILAAEGLNVLTKLAVRNNLFVGVEIGHDKIPVSHLQYADDTIFFGSWSEGNLRNLMKLLKCFELTSGLKINYHKSNLFGVGVENIEIERMAKLFHCNVGSFPFTYLGLPVGGNMRKFESWKPVIEKFEKRLSDWKARSMSFGGRLTLVKSVLNSLPLYYFSLFHAPPCVIKKLECVRRSFFWGGSGNNSKISWVKWEETILPFQEGGLNLGTLKSKNMALIGKWWWRFKTETDSLWVKVISSIYGSSGGLVCGDNLPCYAYKSVWSNIIATGRSIDCLGLSFRSSFTKVIGDGAATAFWDDTWLGEVALKDRFKRLARLEVNCHATVKDRLLCVGAGCTGNWNWVRRPSGRANGELNELNGLLNSVCINPQRGDTWRWSLNNTGKFTTNSLTKLINSKLQCVGSNVLGTLRNNLVPKKVEIFVWRARRKRLPVLLELDKRGIDLHSVRCPICDDEVESVEHSILYCKKALDVWIKIFEWWDITGISSISFNELFQGNSNQITSDGSKSIWQAVIWSSAYLIWKNRNQKIFKNKCSNMDLRVDREKMQYKEHRLA